MCQEIQERILYWVEMARVFSFPKLLVRMRYRPRLVRDHLGYSECTFINTTWLLKQQAFIAASVIGRSRKSIQNVSNSMKRSELMKDVFETTLQVY